MEKNLFALFFILGTFSMSTFGGNNNVSDPYGDTPLPWAVDEVLRHKTYKRSDPVIYSKNTLDIHITPPGKSGYRHSKARMVSRLGLNYRTYNEGLPTDIDNDCLYSIVVRDYLYVDRWDADGRYVQDSGPYLVRQTSLRRDRLGNKCTKEWSAIDGDYENWLKFWEHRTKNGQTKSTLSCGDVVSVAVKKAPGTKITCL